MRGYLDVLPFTPMQLDGGDEQESCNQYADISAVLVEESHRQLLVPSCIHESGNDPSLPEDQGNYSQIIIISTFIQVFLALWIAIREKCSLRGIFLHLPLFG